MKTYSLILLLFVFVSCKNTNSISTQIPVEDVGLLLSDFNKWWTYHYYNVNLSLDFIPYDKDGQHITKTEFLKKLSTGNYITVALAIDDDTAHYKLFKLGDDTIKSIGSTASYQGYIRHKHFMMEGKPFPTFSANTIDGATFSNTSLVGKTTVLKTWFITCAPCVAEFPELNTLVATYKDRDDIQFLSLATDTKAELQTFLTKKPFKYAVLANQKNLIRNELKFNAYPTHLIVDDEGKIEKVFIKASEMMSYLKTK